MKEIPLTLGFSDQLSSMSGKIILTSEALEMLRVAPDHVISFAFAITDDDGFEVIGAALIPTSQMMREPIRDYLKKQRGE